MTYHFAKSKEAIQFQTTSTTAQELIDIFDRIPAKPTHASEQELEAFIKQKFKLTLEIDLQGPGISCINTSALNKNHVFFNEELRKKLDDSDLKSAVHKLKNSKQKNTVNLRDGSVTGIFEEMPMSVDFNVPMLRTFGFNSRELAATFLHEYAHGLTLFEMIGGQSSTNQFLALAFRGIANKDNAETMEILFKTYEEVQGEPGSFKEIYQTKDAALITNVVLLSEIKAAESQLGFRLYDQTSSEAVADDFVGRYGLGLELMSALDKLHSYIGDPQTTESGVFAMNTIAIIEFTLGALAVLLTAAALPILSVACLCAMFMSAYFGASHHKDYTYDSLKVRYQRIRYTAIAALKNDKLDDPAKAKFLIQIDSMDKIIADTYEVRTIYNKLGDIIFRDGARTRDIIAQQHLLEGLINNDFFIHAAKLKVGIKS